MTNAATPQSKAKGLDFDISIFDTCPNGPAGLILWLDTEKLP